MLYHKVTFRQEYFQNKISFLLILSVVAVLIKKTCFLLSNHVYFYYLHTTNNKPHIQADCGNMLKLHRQTVSALYLPNN